MAVKGLACVLKTPVAMEQRMCIRVCFYCLVYCFKYKQMVVAVSDPVRNDSPIVQIEDCTQIYFPDLCADVVFEYSI